MTFDEARDIAIDVLRRLSGNRWTYPVKTVTEVYPMPASRRLFLSGRPVVQIVSVAPLNGYSVSLDPLEWTLYNGFQLEISKNAKILYSICDDQEIEVVYTYGLSALPVGLCSAVDKLANELIASVDDPDNCALPERVTSVTRNGLSMTLLDPQDFLKDGRTGLYEVDLVLAAYNPSNAKARARVFTTANPPAKRRSTS